MTHSGSMIPWQAVPQNVGALVQATSRCPAPAISTMFAAVSRPTARASSARVRREQRADRLPQRHRRRRDRAAAPVEQDAAGEQQEPQDEEGRQAHEQEDPGVGIEGEPGDVESRRGGGSRSPDRRQDRPDGETGFDQRRGRLFNSRLDHAPPVPTARAPYERPVQCVAAAAASTAASTA